MNFDFEKYGYTPVKPDDMFQYHCTHCGECCRNVKEAIMLESMDLFRLARFLEMSVNDVILKYTDTSFLAWWYPILTLKTKQHMDACVFLKSSKCSVQNAKPRTCRIYPLGIGPDDNRPGEFMNFIVSKKRHHFTGDSIRVRDWVAENVTEADREYITADYNMTGEFARIMRKIDKRYEKQITFLFLLYRYLEYDTERDFYEQFYRNMACLKGGLLSIAEGY